MERSITNILVPTNFSPESATALKKAAGIAQQCHAAVTLLHVIDVDRFLPEIGPPRAEKVRQELEREGWGRIAQAARELEAAGVEVRAMVVEGYPCEKICEAARDFDLVVMAKGRPKPFWRLFSRRTTQAVLDGIRCPALVVQEGKESSIRG